MAESAEERGLLAAICESPEDDTPRLVYADWLDDHGRGGHADFIRGQIAIHAMPPDDERWLTLGGRLADLEDRLLPRFRRRLPRGVHLSAMSTEPGDTADRPAHHPLSQCYKGLLAGASADAAVLAQAGDRLLARYPLRSLFTHGTPADAARLAGWEGLSQLHGLRLKHETDHALSAWDVTRSPHLGDLKALWVERARWTPDDIRHLASCSFAGSLRTLHILGPREGFGAARALADADLPSLRRLGLEGYDLGAADLRALAGWPRMEAIESIELARSSLAGPGLHALAEGRHPPRPRALGADCVSGANPPFDGPFFSRIEDLRLGSNLEGLTQLNALLRAPGGSRLWRFELEGSAIGDEGAALLAGWGRLSRAVALRLSNCRIGDEGLTALARSPTLGPVRKLGLSGNQFTARGIGELASSRLMRTVTDLSIYYCRLDAACMDLLASAEMPHLRHLVLNDNKADATPLLRAPWLDQLRMLMIYRKQGPRPVMRALRERLGARLVM